MLDRGVVIPAPHLVEVDAGVDPARIAAGVVIHPGCRIRGARTSIGPSCELGAEQPATVDDCQLGERVHLRGGWFAGAVFLDGVRFAGGAHVRPCALLEEGASAGHAVGLKHTFLMPWVTLGSLINMCDCLIAGGTGPRDHGEVGSSYVHFNFSTHHDKATPSLVGDVPRGVMLDQPPAFLGGQGGMVGPVRVAFGTVVAAGAILRTDHLTMGQLVLPPAQSPDGSPAYDPRAYRDPVRIVRNNMQYLGNLRALSAWYDHARRLRLAPNAWASACHDGAREVIRGALAERTARLAQLLERLPDSLAVWSSLGEGTETVCAAHKALIEAWPAMRDSLELGPPLDTGAADRDSLLEALADAPGDLDWPSAVQALGREARQAGTRWLDAIVASVTQLMPATPAPGQEGG